MSSFDFFLSPTTADQSPGAPVVTGVIGGTPAPLVDYTPITVPAPPLIPSGALPPAAAPSTLTDNLSTNPTSLTAGVLNNIASLLTGPQSTQGSSAGGLTASGAISPNAPSVWQSLSTSPIFLVAVGAIALAIALPYLRGKK
jgi:hypothetical protein